MSWTGNGGLGWYVMWTRFHNDGDVPTQYMAGTGKFNPRLYIFNNRYGHRYQVTNK